MIARASVKAGFGHGAAFRIEAGRAMERRALRSYGLIPLLAA